MRSRLIGFPQKKVPIRQANGSGTSAPEKEAKAERNLAAVEKRTVSRKAGFPIVGLGASAGGVEALVEFFNQMRPDAGIAFVVITHLGQAQSSKLPDLLQKCTKMPVLLVVDRMRLEPNRVFVAQPGYLGVKGERLRFRKAKGRRLPPHPIDYFFRSLAEDQQAFAVGIVLSGSGSDGAVGIGSIKEQLGLVMAQDPQSARYPGMPARAIATRLVDYVLPANKMARGLVSYLKGAYYNSSREDLVAILPLLLQEVIVLIRARTGHDFSGYKPATILGRIERRMAVLQLSEAQEYLDLIKDKVDSRRELGPTCRKTLVFGSTGAKRSARSPMSSD